MKVKKLFVEDLATNFSKNCTVTMTESVDGTSNGTMPMLEGPMIETESVNRNGRVYPIEMMRESVKQYSADRINNGAYRSYGELGHPEGVEINLHRWSHFITELNWQENLVIGKAQLVDTEFGRIAETMVRSNMHIGMSTRGLGALDESQRYFIEGQEADLVTEYEMVAIDIVADPSAPKGFVEGIMEGKSYIIEGGQYSEVMNSNIDRTVRAYDKLEESLKTIPKKDRDAFLANKIDIFFKNLHTDI